MNETDETLYARYLREGDNEDLRVLLERHRERLTMFLYGYVQNMEDAEELMLDAFAAAAAGTTRFSGRSSFKTWLFSIGRHLALRRLRRRSPRTEAFEEQLAAEQTPETELLRQEKYRQLYLALERIHPDYRQALWLLYFEELSHEEIARVTGKSKKQVYNCVTRGKAALRALLEDTENAKL